MKTYHFLLATGISLALAFTFSCSSDDDKGSSGGSFNENSQVYKDGGAPYTGSGIIEMASNVVCWDSEGGGGCEWNGLKAGSIENGIVKLELPENIPNEYLRNFLDGFSRYNCSDPYGDIKIFGGAFVITNINKEYLGELSIYYGDKQTVEKIVYMYFSKAGKINCNYEDEDGKMVTNIDAKEGWNKLYLKANRETAEYTTNNILTKEVRWIFSEY